jgi:hypothetical protein
MGAMRTFALLGVCAWCACGDFSALSRCFNQACASVAVLQTNYACPQTPTQQVDVAFPSAQAVGDLNVVVVGWNDVVASVVDVSDSAGNQYARAVGPDSILDTSIVGTGSSQSIYYAENIKSSVAASNTVSVKFSQAAASPDIRLLEYSGLQSKGAFDTGAGATGSAASASSGAALTHHANELVVGADTLTAATTSAGSGFIQRILTTPDGDMVEDRLAFNAGTFDASMGIGSGPGVWVMQMATFRVAGSP